MVTMRSRSYGIRWGGAQALSEVERQSTSVKDVVTGDIDRVPRAEALYVDPCQIVLR